ncbi:mitochondrial DNA replication protein YHM2 [Colletotrichum melonis]|uniref:Mitochondrial DNA replication protein YHM2 n=1 Tax=Colletotrichum melonis TaxID=1209925 RepID=A0AAI9U387_9PEZI|nr:mitochondrial DNA replication protein YHM2 [Colletotrichum melonis]
MSLVQERTPALPMPRTAPEGQQTTPWRNLAIGSCMQLFQEVIKTHMAANRGDSLRQAVRKTYARGGPLAFYQGLIPWAWIEASTKGSILFLASTETQYYAKKYLDANPITAGVLGGVVGGAAQAYLTMGVTTCMKTIEITRPKATVPGQRVPRTLELFIQVVRKDGIRGINRGVNAVALRQITGWSSRIGISRFVEEGIRKGTDKPKDAKLSFVEKVAASAIGGAISCWNQPFEVIRVEMQAVKKAGNATGASTPTIISTLKHIVTTSGLLSLFRGIGPRIGVAAWATICMVGLGDRFKEFINIRLPT